MEHMNVLCHAVERNDSHELRRILAALGPALASCLLRRYQSDTRESLLHWACRKGCDVSVAQALIQWGEDANSRSGHGARPTPLILACRHGGAHLCDGLIELGADLDVMDDMGETVLHAASSNEAHHDADILRLLLEKHGARYLVNLIDKNGCFPLLIVCDRGSRSVEAADLLIQHGANVNLAGAREGWTALHCACRFNKPDLVSYLLQNGANPMLIDTSHGEYALTKAAENGLVDVVTELLECSVGHTMEALWNGVLMAATQGHSQVVDMILDRMNEQTVNVYLVPCLAAIYHGNLTLLKDKWRTYTKLVDNNITLFRCLLMAAASGRSEIIKYILSWVHVTIDSQDESGLCALHLASYAGHAECVRELVSAGADVNALDKCKKSALLHASFGSSFADVNKCQAVLLTLLQNGAEPNARSLTTTPLHRIAMTGSPEHVRLLFRFGASLIATNSYNKYAIDVAWRPDMVTTFENLHKQRQNMDFDLYMTCNTGIHASLRRLVRRTWTLQLRSGVSRLLRQARLSHKQRRAGSSQRRRQLMYSAEQEMELLTSAIQRLQSWNTPVKTTRRCYEMRYCPRGFAIVINNRDREVQGKSEVDNDIDRLKTMFRFLKFDAIIFEHFSSERIISELAAIARRPELHHHDAIMIVLLSPGCHGSIRGSDGTIITLHDVISIFSNKRCSALAGKPKLILAHACASEPGPLSLVKNVGEASLLGSPCTTVAGWPLTPPVSRESAPREISVDGGGNIGRLTPTESRERAPREISVDGGGNIGRLTPTKSRERAPREISVDGGGYIDTLPTFSDMFVILPRTSGLAVNQIRRGSFAIGVIVDVIMQNAAVMDLCDMTIQMSGILSQHEMYADTWSTLTKRLYFFPHGICGY